jgi:hypothetical protein
MGCARAGHPASRAIHRRPVCGGRRTCECDPPLVKLARPILIANLPAWPVGYLVAQLFLHLFPDRIDLTPAPFLISLAGTFLIGLITVMAEVLKAASVRPAEVLRQA